MVDRMVSFGRLAMLSKVDALSEVNLLRNAGRGSKII